MVVSDFYENPKVGDRCFVANDARKEANLYDMLDTSPLGLNYGVVINVYKNTPGDDDYVDVKIETGKDKGKVLNAMRYNSMQCFPFYLYIKFAQRVGPNMLSNASIVEKMINKNDESNIKGNRDNVISVNFKK